MSSFTNSTVLVVGGVGFVGGQLVKMILREKPKHIIVVDNLLSSERENVPVDSVIHFIEGSITQDAVLQQLADNIDYVFHLATYHGNQSSIADPLADHENNTYTTLRLYEHIKNFKNIKKIVYSGAGCVAAEKTFAQAQATTEETMPSLFLDSPYQISKLIGELYSNYYFKHHNLPIVKARFQNVYGPGEVLGAGKWRGTIHTVWRNVIPTFIYRGLKHLPLTVENGGIATRDFIHVDDIARGLIACAFAGNPGENYNLASGVETSIRELAEQINKITKNSQAVSLLPKRAWDNSGTRYGSTTKSAEQLHFNAQIDLATGLRETVAWTQQNLPWIEACINKHQQYMKEICAA